MTRIKCFQQRIKMKESWHFHWKSKEKQNTKKWNVSIVLSLSKGHHIHFHSLSNVGRNWFLIVWGPRPICGKGWLILSTIRKDVIAGSSIISKQLSYPCLYILLPRNTSLVIFFIINSYSPRLHLIRSINILFINIVAFWDV